MHAHNHTPHISQCTFLFKVISFQNSQFTRPLKILKQGRKEENVMLYALNT